MRFYLLWLHIESFFQDKGVQVSVILGGMTLIDVEIIFRMTLGIPGAVYILLKIYREFIKKQKPNDKETVE